jgi:hypothetical protein
MKRLLAFSLICFLSGLLTIGCERGVRAGREADTETYQPRSAPREEGANTGTNQGAHQDMKGELTRVDSKNNTISVRAENGMEQTFKFNDRTTVQGLDRQSTNQPKAGQTGMQVGDLMGKEGSEITIMWKDEAGAKMATNVEVNDQAPAKGNSKTKSQNRY